VEGAKSKEPIWEVKEQNPQEIPSNFTSSMASFYDRPLVEVDANVDATEESVDNPSHVSQEAV
jgi:hypothetical protein